MLHRKKPFSLASTSCACRISTGFGLCVAHRVFCQGTLEWSCYCRLEILCCVDPKAKILLWEPCKRMVGYKF